MGPLLLLVLVIHAQGRRDSECGDVSYSGCASPTITSPAPADNLATCFILCQGFNKFGQCDYFIYYDPVSTKDNCVMAYGGMTFEIFINSCGQKGGPLFNSGNHCFANSEGECPSSEECHGECEECGKEDACWGVRETSCSMLDSDHTDTSDVQSEDECRQLCVEKNKHFTYYTFNIPRKACTCLASGDRHCNALVVTNVNSLDTVESCNTM